MLKFFTFAILSLSSVILFGQNLNMTFTAAGASDKVDSVKATNLRSAMSVTLPGNDTLVLAVTAGITTLSDANHGGIVFPNPFSGMTTLVANIQKPQTVSLEVFNLAGQSVARGEAFVQPGSNAFALSLSKIGIYMVSLTTNMGTEGFKVICTETTGVGNSIRHAGIAQGGNLIPSFKNTTIYTLGYWIGDIILYRCRGGIYTTIITDSPTASKSYEVTFAPCTDPDGKSYAIVKIGAQTWMAENLAWLPAVSASSRGSESLKYYYVYNYEDSVVAAAKNTSNYKLYGALYNRTAAMNEGGKSSAPMGRIQSVCPTGWHLPDDGEWKILEKSLGMSQPDADTVNLRSSGEVGKKLKSSVNWFEDGNGSNLSGFTALAGGYRNTHGGFASVDNYSLFWTASLSDTLAWYRSLSYTDNGVSRFTTLKSHGFSVRCIKN
ncbi:MAG: FISUMP domain-containing protein [Bacteroidota bacterium]